MNQKETCRGGNPRELQNSSLQSRQAVVWWLFGSKFSFILLLARFLIHSLALSTAAPSLAHSFMLSAYSHALSLSFYSSLCFNPVGKPLTLPLMYIPEFLSFSYTAVHYFSHLLNPITIFLTCLLHPISLRHLRVCVTKSHESGAAKEICWTSITNPLQAQYLAICASQCTC